MADGGESLRMHTVVFGGRSFFSSSFFFGGREEIMENAH